MASRVELQYKLEDLLGSSQVYYQPPDTIKMEYPAIVYSKTRIDSTFADDASYLIRKQYEIIVISKSPDNPVINKILQLPMCTFNRHYKSDNLNHDVLTLYF